ncbi:topoisomerase I binding, arginine/serine-rich a [Melanotaenia boesemani]|uniref:topoisomerase I binding, arginine/serine-rich a n=1 Tax=Melanotaenia boesemani TaxID=1250792 RepID=UPI001C03AC50|nr:topoisomerase I binding, arginine/serine-rich a [Melanotaenia boesemani]
MSAIKIALQQSQTSGKRKNCGAMSAEVSPDSKCPICLDIFHDISYVNRCLHKFCFRCILEWSKNKAECPLCKQPFNSIYHSIKSDEDFQKYELKQHVDNSSFGYFEGVRFRYRTTLTGVHRQVRGRTSPPPDNGVMFEASTNPTQQRQDRYIRRMMMRLAAKRRAASEGRAVANVREQEMINFRRELYRRGVRIRNVQDGGRSRDTSAEFYRRNPACLHRLVPWLKRELVVLYGAHGSLVNIVQHIIMSRITCYDMEDGAIQEELRPFLQGRTEHFLHEFISFAKSPFNMEAYDQHAVYDCPAPSSNEGSSSNSSVIAISEDENSVEMDHPIESSSALSYSVWDDETPGPSYSTTAEQGRTEHLSVLDTDSDSSSEEERRELDSSPQQMSSHNQTDMTQVDSKNVDCTSSDNDCVIVGFIKPTVERTPELVQLSSDSDESSSEDTKEFPRQPQHIRFTSCSPAASRSSNSSRAGQSENVETDNHHQLNLREQNNSSLSSRHKTSNKTENIDGFRERHKSKDRDHRRKKKKSKSRDRRSPVISHSSVSSRSTERGYSFSRGRAFSKHDRNYERRDSDHSYQSYSHYRRERNGSVTHYTQRQSYYYSSHKYSDLRLRSRSRSRSRDSQRRDRRRSRSRTYSSSCSPSAKRECHQDKPGGKRKYKTRHLEEPSTKIHSSPYREGDSMSLTKHKKRKKEKRHKKSRERSKKTSMELVDEERAHERSKHHHKKKKHKKKSKRRRSVEHKEKGSPAVITIDSDSDCLANDSQCNGTKREDVIKNATDDQVDHLHPD